MTKKYKKAKMTEEERKAKQTDQVLNKLIDRVNDTGLMPWQKPWQGVESNVRPFNFVSGREYNGTNIMLLHFASFGKIPAFSAVNKSLKIFPKKGTKACYILKPRNIRVEDKKTGEEKNIFMGCNLIPVYHYTDLQNVDCEAIEAKYAPKTDKVAPTFNDIALAESVFTEMQNPPKLDNMGGDRACYIPSQDRVSLPKKDTFDTENAYYQTMFHELAHATGHFTRLDRFKKTKKEFDNHNHSYSFEELVAELTACFIGSQTGTLSDKECDNSASYLKNWVSKLRDNPDWLILAATQANKASEYILGKTMQPTEATEA